MAPKLNILKKDAWLEPYAQAITGRHQDAIRKEKELLSGGTKTLSDFANAYNYFGLHRAKDGSWIFREWAPNATAITLTGDFSGWEIHFIEIPAHVVFGLVVFPKIII